MIKGILFDFDGTISDSSEGIFSTSTTVATSMGYKGPWSDEQLRKFVGPPLRECFRITFGMKEEELDEAVTRYRKIYRETGYKQCVLYPEMEKLLSSLKSMGYKLGVATNKEQYIARKCVEVLGLDYLFDDIFGTDDKGRLKKSDLIKASFSSFGLSADEILMVGDTENDLHGAQEAETGFLAVTWGFGFSLPWTLNEVDYVENTMDVLEYVNKKNGGKI